MKNNVSLSSPFLFNPQMSFVGTWPTVRPPKRRTLPRAIPLTTETQIDHKQEFICGVILILCTLFSLAAFVAQFALA